MRCKNDQRQNKGFSATRCRNAMESVCMCVCMCVRARARVYVYVCAWVYVRACASS